MPKLIQAIISTDAQKGTGSASDPVRCVTQLKMNLSLDKMTRAWNRINMTPEQKKEFKSKLAKLINKYSLENNSDTPDYILTDYLFDCMVAFNNATIKRDVHNNPDGVL